MCDDRSEQTCDCQRVASHALVLDIDVQDSFGAGLEGRLSVRVGAEQKELWAPTPVSSGSGIRWERRTLQAGEPLQVGLPLGAFLFWLEDQGMWTLAGMPLFGTSSTGLVLQERLSTCVPPLPEVPPGLKVLELDRYMASCPEEERAEAEEVRSSIRESVLEYPLYTVAAMCRR